MKLTKYVRLFYTDVMLEMSQKRRDAHASIRSDMFPLLYHLIALKEGVVSRRDLKKYEHEINVFRSDIEFNNQRRDKNGKVWFDDDYLQRLSSEIMEGAVRKYMRKYDQISTKNFYFDITDFPNFSWHGEFKL